MYPLDKILAIFQPHLYSRTRDFQEGFAKSLAQFNQVLVLPIYAAREKPIDGISSKVLVEKIGKINQQVTLIKPTDISKKINQLKIKIIVMMGAGDIGEMIKETQQKLENIEI